MPLLFLWIACGIIAGMIGRKKNCGCSAQIWGFLLGPFGVVLALVRRGNLPPCPFCKEPVQTGAQVCPHCRKELKP